MAQNVDTKTKVMATVPKSSLGQCTTKVVLVVDDAPEILAIAKHYLLDQNLHTLFATDAQAAFQEVASRQRQGLQIDMVVTDIAMPIETGIQLAKRLKGMNFKGKILAISAHAAILSDSNELSIFDGFLPKPFRKNDFCFFVSKHLESESSQPEAREL